MAELGFASKEQVRAAPYTIIDTYGRRAAAQNMAVSCNHLCANPWLALPAAWYFCVSQTPHVLLRTLRSRVCGVRHDSCVQLAGWKVTIVGPRMGKQLTGVRVLGSAPAPCCSNVLQHVLGSRLPAHFSIRRFIIDDARGFSFLICGSIFLMAHISIFLGSRFPKVGSRFLRKRH